MRHDESLRICPVLAQGIHALQQDLYGPPDLERIARVAVPCVFCRQTNDPSDPTTTDHDGPRTLTYLVT